MFDIAAYYEADSVANAIQYLQEHSDARLIAGGTDVLIKLRERKEEYLKKTLVGITRIAELNQITMESNGDILIGSACSFTKVENDPIVLKHIPSLAQAVGTVGGPQIRNMGTIGGNICNGATSADSATTLLALDAVLIIESAKGRREESIHNFYQGPGKVALSQDDLLIAIKIEKDQYQGYQGHYIKFAQRNAMDIANLGCSILVKTDKNRIEDLRVAFGVAGPIPLRAKAAEEYAVGKEISPEVLQKIGELCLEDTKARDSWRASKAFREQLIQTLPGRAIEKAMNASN